MERSLSMQFEVNEDHDFVTFAQVAWTSLVWIFVMQELVMSALFDSCGCDDGDDDVDDDDDDDDFFDLYKFLEMHKYSKTEKNSREHM